MRISIYLTSVVIFLVETSTTHQPRFPCGNPGLLINKKLPSKPSAAFKLAERRWSCSITLLESVCFHYFIQFSLEPFSEPNLTRLGFKEITPPTPNSLPKGLSTLHVPLCLDTGATTQLSWQWIKLQLALISQKTWSTTNTRAYAKKLWLPYQREGKKLTI